MSQILQTTSNIISYVSIAIICYGAALGLLKFISNEFGRFSRTYSLEKTVQIKIEVGYYLLLGLNF
nr:hypothetical protein [Pedobacter panaciterrae]